ncbi:hypothetical protein Pan153_32960 [Gimesia panareensis]|uniref:DUF1559 domain-containing protein n=1 Tax=Gimesia panareensis TaxID=2527978 RepID=A0A518FQK8_9PLAN|nr:DUF1559 domain-containing protein [Gimesia panareensis]QDV18636.1 hypothetical protein Pan153_32960 [Gimesia panareensis]
MKVEPKRRLLGFTLIELLVSMSIIALLVSLLLPAVQQTRESARRMSCLNHMRQLGLAVHNHADVQKRFPASGYLSLDSSGSVQPFFNWAVAILPYIEQNALYDQWDFSQPSLSAGNAKLSETVIPLFTCSSDITLGGRGDLSYAINGGIAWTSTVVGVPDCPIVFPSRGPIDLNGNGIKCPLNPSGDGSPSDRDLLLKTGVCFLESWKVEGTSRHHRFATITDGLSNTLLFAENVRVGYDPKNPQKTWSFADPLATSFYIPSQVCQGDSCAPGNVSLGNANGAPHGINYGINLAEGEAPWPSAFHQGGVNVVFTDGRATFLSENINGNVYYSMVTSQGLSLPAQLRDTELSPAQ